MMAELFVKTAELGIALGWKNLVALPGCAEHQIDEQWWFAINAHNKRTKCSKGISVPPCSIYYEFNGWPFGVCGVREGLCGAGSLANEDTLLRAIEIKTAELKTKRRNDDCHDGQQPRSEAEHPDSDL